MKRTIALLLALLLMLGTLPALAATYKDSDNITSVQEALKSAGYYNGNPDGKLNSATTKAIKAYQADHGMKESGSIDDDLIASLGIPLCYTDSKTIKAVQNVLRDLGYLSAKADGKLGSKTKNALYSYRTDNDLPGNYRIDENVLMVMGIHEMSDEMKLVKQVQQALIDADAVSYNKDRFRASGSLGNDTKTNIRRFQSDNGMEQTGEIDDTLLALLGLIPLTAEMEQIQVIQQILIDDPYTSTSSSMKANGVLNGYTVSAIQNYEMYHDMPATGEISDDLLRVMGLLELTEEMQQVKTVQQMLLDAGYLWLETYVSGYLGESTQSVLRSYRSDCDLPQEGGIDDDLLLALGLREATGEEQRIKAVQQALFAAGKLNEKYVTGILGEHTVSAISNFQRSLGVPQTGEIDDWLLMSLGLAEESEEFAQIKAVQQALRRFSLASPSVSGCMDDNTAEGIIKAEKEFTLPESGAVTKALLNVLGLLEEQAQSAEGYTFLGIPWGANLNTVLTAMTGIDDNTYIRLHGSTGGLQVYYLDAANEEYPLAYAGLDFSGVGFYMEISNYSGTIGGYEPWSIYLHFAYGVDAEDIDKTQSHLQQAVISIRESGGSVAQDLQTKLTTLYGEPKAWESDFREHAYLWQGENDTAIVLKKDYNVCTLYYGTLTEQAQFEALLALRSDAISTDLGGL